MIAFTDSIIIFKNFRDNDVFIFDGQGKALKKLSRGPSGREYLVAHGVVYDDKNRELFINDLYAHKIKVYDLDGEFKRALPYITADTIHYPFLHGYVGYDRVLNYDNESLICYVKLNMKNPVFLISKQTGEKLKDIIIPYRKRVFVDYETPGSRAPQINYQPLLKAHDGIIIAESSSDTIYHLSYKNTVLRPILYRTPSIQTMKTPVFVIPMKNIGSVLFVNIVKKENYNYTYRAGSLMCEYKEGKGIYDIAKTNIPMWYSTNFLLEHEIRQNVFLSPSSADLVSKFYQTSRLPEDMKEIASHVKEDDNPVMAIFTIQK